MISLIDYGAGNLQSVMNTLAAVGAPYELIREPASVRSASKIILPGVGHFGQIARALDEMNVRQALLERIAQGVPYLGICLGLQILFTNSEEAPEEQGLGVCPGTVKRFQGDMRIPHMGWNELAIVKPSRLLSGAVDKPYFYFANSYYCPVGEDTAATCEYSIPFTAVLDRSRKDGAAPSNVFGVQFHPERSGDVGLRIVRNFVENVC